MTELNNAEINAVSGARLSVGESAGITAGLMIFGGPVGVAVGCAALMYYAFC
jgi:uncharacterized protein YaaW (UPF0174 family)